VDLCNVYKEIPFNLHEHIFLFKSFPRGGVQFCRSQDLCQMTYKAVGEFVLTALGGLLA
jgi:hypothetical protein